MLCDVSNVYLSAANFGYDAYAYIDAFPAGAVAELHLGGFTQETDDSGAPVLIDTHAAAIAEPVWDLYAHALRRFGPRPTLIEWDNALPVFATARAEAEHADSVADAALVEEEIRVLALVELQQRFARAMTTGDAAALAGHLVGGSDPGRGSRST